MTEFLFGVLAFLAMLGWGVTNALTSRNHLREANALQTVTQVSNMIDANVSTVLERYQALKRSKQTSVEEKTQTVLDDEAEARRERIRQGIAYTGTSTDEDLGSLGVQPLGEVE